MVYLWQRVSDRSIHHARRMMGCTQWSLSLVFFHKRSYRHCHWSISSYFLQIYWPALYPVLVLTHNYNHLTLSFVPLLNKWICNKYILWEKTHFVCTSSTWCVTRVCNPHRHTGKLSLYWRPVVWFPSSEEFLVELDKRCNKLNPVWVLWYNKC